MYDERKAAAGFPDRELVVLKFPPTLWFDFVGVCTAKAGWPGPEGLYTDVVGTNEGVHTRMGKRGLLVPVPTPSSVPAMDPQGVSGA